jgi:hypothetical protein
VTFKLDDDFFSSTAETRCSRLEASIYRLYIGLPSVSFNSRKLIGLYVASLIVNN